MLHNALYLKLKLLQIITVNDKTFEGENFHHFLGFKYICKDSVP